MPVAALEEFVRAGGRLVAIGNATEFAVDLFDLPVTNAVDDLRPQDFYVPGSIVRIDVEAGDPLAGGVGDHVFGWYWGDSRAFKVTGENVRVVARYGAGNPKVSGWILGPEHIAGKPALISADVGEGSVVLFGFQPNYRGQSIATWPLLWAALTP